MKMGMKNRLAVKIAFYLMIALAVFSVFLLAFLYYSTNSRKQTDEGLNEIHGKTMIKSFSSNILFGVLSQNTEVLGTAVDSLFEDPTISYVVIYDDGGKEIFYRDKQDRALTDYGFKAPDIKKGKAPSDEIAVAKILYKSSEQFMDFLVPVLSQETRFGTSAKDKRLVGFVRIGISLAALNQQTYDAIKSGAILILALMGLGGFLIWVSLRLVTPPINRLASAARRIGQGEFDVVVEVTSDDEIGLLTETFNEMVKNIREQTIRTRALMDNIAQAVKMLTETTSQLLSVSSEQASGATEQAAIVQEVVSTTEEIAATATRIADTAGAVHESSQNATEAAYKGKDFVESIVRDMETIRGQVDKGTEQIMTLAQQAQMIGGVLEIIEEISERTNLLALNAAIEAAGAGEAGKRFSVVSGEVRHLANRTLESTDSVKKMIDAIRNSTSAIVMLSENEQKAVAAGAESVIRLGEYFQHILEMVESTRQSASEIGLITRQQSTATEQMVVSIREVEEVVKEVESGVKEIETLMADLSELAARLQSNIEERG